MKRLQRRSTGALAAAGLLAGAVSARAQVNVESLRSQLTERDFAGRVAASVASYAGNTEGVVLGISTQIGLRSTRHVAYLAGSGSYARLDGVISIANWFAHLRHNYWLTAWLSWEAFAQLESDRFRRTTLRELLGTGPRFRLVGSEAIQVFHGAAYMLEHTNLSGADPGQGGTFHRFSNYTAATLRADPRISLTLVTYFQPRFDAPSDFRLLSTANVDMQVTKRLHSRLDAKLRHESRPPADVEPADFELVSSIELTF